MSRKASIAILALLTSTTAIHAAPPPNVVQSDANMNTAMGRGVLSQLTTGTYNTGGGWTALNLNTTGSYNTGFGAGALLYNRTGSFNTALGSSTLTNATAGMRNSGVGYGALFRNNSNDNSAFGYEALSHNTSGIDNTALGSSSMQWSTTGIRNTATGARALEYNTTGNQNTANGYAALGNNVGGQSNTAVGAYAMFYNTGGNENIALGYAALYGNTTASQNLGLGNQTLQNNKTGVRNVGLGWRAGFNVTGSDNIVVGAGNEGRAGENGVIRLGASGYQTRAFIAGVSGVKTGLAAATAVFVDANGQLGTVKSSRQYKQDIRDMGSVSERLLALHPVTFRYKQEYDDGSRPLEFGLIAEEVATAFPELVVTNAEGKPETVRYDLLATLLLNEFQKDHQRLEALEKQAAELAELKSQVAAMSAMMKRAQPSDPLTAAR